LIKLSNAEIDDTKSNPDEIIKTFDLNNIDSSKLYYLLSEILMKDSNKINRGNSCLVLTLLSYASTFDNFINLKFLNG